MVLVSQAVKRRRGHSAVSASIGRTSPSWTSGCPDLSGIDAMIAIRAEFPEARIIMLTTFEGDVEIQRALQAGARGYLLKNMPPGEILRGHPPGARRKETRAAGSGGPACRAYERRRTDRPRGRGPAEGRRRQSESGHRRAFSSFPRRPSRSTSSTSWTSSARRTARRPSPSRCAAGSSSYEF